MIVLCGLGLGSDKLGGDKLGGKIDVFEPILPHTLFQESLALITWLGAKEFFLANLL